MNPGEEILNLLDLNWYFYVKAKNMSKVFDIDTIEIALSLDDAIANRPHDLLEDYEYLPADQVKVCNQCGSAKLVILKDTCLCVACNQKQNPNQLIFRNQYNKHKNENI